MLDDIWIEVVRIQPTDAFFSLQISFVSLPQPIAPQKLCPPVGRVAVVLDFLCAGARFGSGPLFIASGFCRRGH